MQASMCRPTLLPSFFAQPVLNSPYEHPQRRWELGSVLPQAAAGGLAKVGGGGE